MPKGVYRPPKDRHRGQRHRLQCQKTFLRKFRLQSPLQCSFIPNRSQKDSFHERVKNQALPGRNKHFEEVFPPQHPQFPPSLARVEGGEGQKGPHNPALFKQSNYNYIIRSENPAPPIRFQEKKTLRKCRFGHQFYPLLYKRP